MQNVTKSLYSISMYETKNYNHLVGIGQISDEAMQMHFRLYDGYVKNTNLLLEKLQTLTPNSPEYNELHRRFGWEFNGMRLHEIYFDSLTAEIGDSNPIGEVKNKIVENFGSVEEWVKDFANIAKMRGMGWVMLVQDNKTGKLVNTWVNEHDAGMMADVKIILNVDMFEHAYVKDFGLDRQLYLESVFSHINWEVISERLV